MKELQMLLTRVLAERLKANKEADKNHTVNEYLYAHWYGKVDAFNLVIQESELLLNPQPNTDPGPQLNKHDVGRSDRKGMINIMPKEWQDRQRRLDNI